MSTSRTPKTFVALCFGAALLALSGCSGSGSTDDPSGAPDPGAPGDISGSLSPTDRAPEAPEVRSADKPENGSAAAESTDFAPVDIELKDGRFAPATPRTIHVPSGFIVIVSARADDHGRYRLGVQSPSVAQTFFIPAGGQHKITLDAMREGQVATITLGTSRSQRLRIAADAEPGP